MARIYIDQKVWEKCESRDCVDFANCVDREAGLLVLPADKHHRLVTLICEAIQDENHRGQAAPEGQALSKSTEMEQSLEELQNPALAEALREEGRQKCGVTHGTEPGTGGVPKER